MHASAGAGVSVHVSKWPSSVEVEKSRRKVSDDGNDDGRMVFEAIFGRVRQGLDISPGRKDQTNIAEDLKWQGERKKMLEVEGKQKDGQKAG